MFFVPGASLTGGSQTEFLAGTSSLVVAFGAVPFASGYRIAAAFDAPVAVPSGFAECAELGAAVKVAFVLVALTVTLAFVGHLRTTSANAIRPTDTMTVKHRSLTKNPTLSLLIMCNHGFRILHVAARQKLPRTAML